jgi:LysM repeat protein
VVHSFVYYHSMPLWWNGRHDGLKIHWTSKVRAGSSPASGTTILTHSFSIATLTLCTFGSKLTYLRLWLCGIWIISLLWSHSFGQKTSNYPFIRYSENYLEYNDPKIVQPFLKKWNAESPQSIQILHFGDSHVQPDFSTAIIRSRLQTIKGDAGRGLIFPFSIAKTHSHMDFTTRHTGVWVSASHKQAIPSLPLGISGFVAHTRDPKAGFSFTFRETPVPGLKMIKVYCQSDSDNFILEARTAGLVQRIDVPKASYTPLPFVTFYFVQLGSVLEFKVITKQGSSSTFKLYGVSIENNRPGVIYHNVGVSGARFSAIENQDLFEPQFSYMRPDLVVLDWGTNDIVHDNKIPPRFRELVIGTIDRIRRVSPQSVILLTSVQDMNRRGRNISVASSYARMMRSIAYEKGCLFYDWYHVSGGAGSMKRWHQYQLAQKDQIHLTFKGYQLKGTLMADAILTSLSQLRKFPDQPMLRSGGTVEIASPQVEETTTQASKPTQQASTGNKKTKTPQNTVEESGTYVVKAGDTLLRIADEHGLSLTELMRFNQLKSLELREGQILRFKPILP